LKPINWLGDSRKAVCDFSDDARRDAGFQLDRVQRGKEPHDWKPMNAIGSGVREIRIHEENEYRVLYIAKFAEAVYVLHAFTKKTQQTRKEDLELAAQRYRQLANQRDVK
jgi:phage-related protein